MYTLQISAITYIVHRAMGVRKKIEVKIVILKPFFRRSNGQGQVTD